MLERFCSDFPSVMNVTKEQVVHILQKFHLIAVITREAWFIEEGYLEPDDSFIVPFLVPGYDHKNGCKHVPNTKDERVIYFYFDSGFIPTSLLNQLITACIGYNVNKNSPLLW